MCEESDKYWTIDYKTTWAIPDNISYIACFWYDSIVCFHLPLSPEGGVLSNDDEITTKREKMPISSMTS